MTNTPKPRRVESPTQPTKQSSPREDVEPKPYELISLPKLGPKRSEPAGQDRFKSDRLSGKINLRLTVKTTAFVASGVVAMGSDLSNQTRSIALIKTSVQRDRKLIIPGSSLKGVVRSTYEAITASCLCKTKADRNAIPDGYRECTDKTKLCPACQVFGAMGWQGLIRFADAVANDAKLSVGFMPSLYAPRKQRQAYYVNGKVAGRKFYYHTIRAVDKGQQKGIAVQQAGGEVIFTTQVHFMNLTQAELGTLLIVLGQDKPKNPIALKVGGGKPIGMGTLEVEVSELNVVTNDESLIKQFQLRKPRDRYSSYDSEFDSLTDAKLQQFMQQAIQSSQGLVQAQQLQELKNVLQWPTDRPPPEGMY